MKTSLGALLALGMAGLQFLAVLAVVTSSYLTSERALIDHARDLMRDVGINTIEHSKGFLSPAQGAAELAARLAQSDVISSKDAQLLEKLLFQQLQIAPQFAGAYYGDSAGNFTYVMRSPKGPGPFRSKLIQVDGVNRTTEFIWRNNDFSIAARRMDPSDSFDPRNRPWYIKARAELATIWTDPYIFFSSLQPGITLAAPVFQDGDEISGVVGVDIEISMISDFLSRLNIGRSGKALIIYRNGDVIAHPDQSLLKTESADGTLRFVNITEIDDPIARAAFGPLAEAGEIPVTQETKSQFMFNGAAYVATTMPVISAQLPWTIGVYAPEDDFIGAIKRNRMMNIWLAALVALLTAGIGLGLAKYIYRPVRAFAVRTALISQGEIDPHAPLPKTYRELERANEALVQEIVARRDAEQEYGQTFFMSVRGMAQITSDRGIFLRVNARICEITGYDSSELEGTAFGDLFPPQLASPWTLGHDNESEDFAINRDLQLLRKDGELLWVTVNAIVIRDRRGHAMHVVITMEDITQSKRNEEQIERLNKDLSHLARGHTVGHMASGLAHELNQPLTAIAQNADTALLVLSQQSLPGEELREILTEIEQQSLRAGGIIRALRGFIRKDEGERVSFDLAVLIEQTLQLLRPEATEAAVEITTKVDDNLPFVVGNRVQVAQVIVNLLRNAIEALAASTPAPRHVTISASGINAAPGFVRVTVEDNGPGVDPAVQLFTQFETTKSSGMGLGLSICRSIVEANGGVIGYHRAGSGGSVFEFTLPINQAR